MKPDFNVPGKRRCAVYEMNLSGVMREKQRIMCGKRLLAVCMVFLGALSCTPTFPGPSASRKPGLRKQFTSSHLISMILRTMIDPGELRLLPGIPQEITQLLDHEPIAGLA